MAANISEPVVVVVVVVVEVAVVVAPRSAAVSLLRAAARCPARVSFSRLACAGLLRLIASPVVVRVADVVAVPSDSAIPVDQGCKKT